MGLEDRDWYREEPSKAWRGGTSSSSPRSGSRPRVRPGAWLAMLVSAVLVAAGLFWNPFSLALPGQAVEPNGPAKGAPTRTVPAPRAAEPSSKIVRLRTVPGLDKPATRVSRWHLTDPRFGEVIVYVPIGKTPREALTLELAARGYQVVSS